MSDDPAAKVNEVTLDGKPVRLHELSPGWPENRVDSKRYQRFFRNLSLFLAGLYTGEGCSGRPHSERAPRSSTAKKQDAE
jgi:hypothetical protein